MLVRWTDPFENFIDLFNVQRGRWTPWIETKEEDNQFVIDVELPGMDEKDVKITVDGSALVIEGEKKTDKISKSFVRSFTLPPSVDSEKIEALFDKGILTVKIPKIPEKAPRNIEVKANGPPKRIVNR